MRKNLVRRGQANLQWILIAGAIVLAIAGTIATLGNRTSTKLNETATDVANPVSLKNRFGSSTAPCSSSLAGLILGP